VRYGNISERKYVKKLSHGVNKNKVSTMDEKTMFLDEGLTLKISALIKKRDFIILLERFSYLNETKKTIKSLAAKNSVSKQRIKQILIKIDKKIIDNYDEIFDDLIEHLKKLGKILYEKTAIKELINNSLWQRGNENFFSMFCRSYLGRTNKVIVDDDFFILTNQKELKKMTVLISAKILTAINHLKSPLSCDDLISQLKKRSDLTEKIKDEYLTPDLMLYASKLKKQFFIVDGLVYNKMMYYMIYGRKLQDIIYWSLKYLEAPKHFSELTVFVKEHNKKFFNTSYLSVLATLIREKKLFKRVAVGTYSNIESKASRHIIAIEAIINLLTKNGPMTRSQIIHLLLKKYKRSNLNAAFRYHKRKFKISASNMYDLAESVN